MKFIDLLIQTRKSKGLSQDVLAKACHVSQQAYSEYERRVRPIPADIAYKVANALGSSRLIAEYDFEYGISIIKVPVLNNVDDHHIVVAYRLLKEFEEAKQSAMDLINLIENKSDDSLTIEDWDKIYDHEIQILDTLACVQMHIITMEEKFNSFSKDKLERMQNQRLKTKGYY